jgi:hypothetical protein
LILNSDIFINCPFTKDYSPFYDAAIFAIIYCSCVPRCSREFPENSSYRLENICALIGQSRLAIHDISYTKLDKHRDTGEELPRFNMPLELGLFIGATKFGDQSLPAKKCLIFDRDEHRFRAFISDLNGYDISPHEDVPSKMVATIASWLRDELRNDNIPGGTYIMEKFAEFQADLPTILELMRLQRSELSFQSYRNTAQQWIAKKEASLATTA